MGEGEVPAGVRGERVARPAKALPPRRRVGRPTMLAYGFGAVAYGIKDNGFGTFLLIFYNQVVGLPSAAVGFVVMCALVMDALIDPAIGFFSDRTRSRWGRRHPWMYGSAIPIALGWMLLWHPPAGWGSSEILLWLFGSAVLVRTAVSAYEVPSVALTPELTSEYDERTRIMAYRYVFGWAGGLIMLLLAYTVFLTPEPGQANGLLNREGYSGYAIAGAAAMFAAILISALGTHHEIKRLPRPEIARVGLVQGFRELLETANNRAFLILMAAGLCQYTNQGIGFALSTYLYSYVWRFDTTAFAMLAGVLFLGVLIAFVSAPALARRIGKPRAAAAAITGAGVLMVLPYALRLAGLFPAPDAPTMPWVLFAIYVVNTACNVGAAMLGGSMMADVVEHSEAHTGRRSEGVFFAGAFFVQKCTGGVGIFVAGAILWSAGFPANAHPGMVGAATIDRLTIIFGLVYLTLAFLAAWLFRRFPFDRAEHAARIRQLAGD